MRKWFWTIMMLSASLAFAQKPQYIVFEEHVKQDTIILTPFKLLNSRVDLTFGGKKTRLSIFNLYFSKSDFRAHGLDRKAFTKSAADYRKIENDLLITLTPLTDSLNNKLTKLSDNQVKALDIIKPEELLQKAIKNLYRCFTENDIAKDDIPGVIKTTMYNLIIKKEDKYYKVGAPVLTEYYLIDRANYLFPSQYHYGEINVGSRQQTRYFSGDDIDSLLKQNPSGTMNNYNPVITISRRTFVSAEIIKDSCAIYTYWTYPAYLGSLFGIGRFQFIEGIGIVNGTFGTYFDKHFMSTLENSSGMPDFNGEFKLQLQTINGKGLKETYMEMTKFKKKGQIIGEE